MEGWSARANATNGPSEVGPCIRRPAGPPAHPASLVGGAAPGHYSPAMRPVDQPAPTPLDPDDVDADPTVQFARWYEEAAAAVRGPEEVVVATADGEGRPSARMVLCRGFGPEGFVFYTNYGSAKSADLTANPQAALLFYWEPLGRQVRIEGRVEQTTAEESDEYFASRPRVSQLGAHASRQSQPIAHRQELEARVEALELEYANLPVPRPAGWGGWRLVPDYFEFWQDGAFRLHDRVVYRPTADGWKITRLQP